MSTKPGKPKPEDGIPPCVYCGGEELYRPAPKYARCLKCGMKRMMPPDCVYCGGVSNYDPVKAFDIAVARDAVIEAAKARDSFGVALSCLEHADNRCLSWCDACKYGYAADSALVAAIEALEVLL